jgi:hypothetical protein
MSGFQKRVALLEKWVPSLLPQLKNIDDMAEIILDVWDEAEAHTEERIIKLLEERTNDSGSVLDETGNSIADLSDLIELIKGETND